MSMLDDACFIFNILLLNLFNKHFQTNQKPEHFKPYKNVIIKSKKTL